jgi:hypothetical protein
MEIRTPFIRYFINDIDPLLHVGPLNCCCAT